MANLNTLINATLRYEKSSPKIVSFQITPITANQATITVLDEDGKMWGNTIIKGAFYEWIPYPPLPKRNSTQNDGKKPYVPESPRYPVP